MLYNFPHYFPPFLSSLNHVLDSCDTTFPTTFPLPFLFEPRSRFMLYNFPHYFLSAFWEQGSPDLAACGLRRSSKGAQHDPSSLAQAQDPCEGPSLAGRTTRSFLRHGLVRLAREEAERSRRGTSRGARDASHDDSGCQAGASPRSVLLSSLVQREQAQVRASSKGIHFGATRPRPAQRQGGSHFGAQAGVTTRAFDRRGPTLVRISVPAVPLQNGQLLAPFPLNYWEEAQGLAYK